MKSAITIQQWWRQSSSRRPAKHSHLGIRHFFLFVVEGDRFQFTSWGFRQKPLIPSKDEKGDDCETNKGVDKIHREIIDSKEKNGNILYFSLLLYLFFRLHLVSVETIF